MGHRRNFAVTHPIEESKLNRLALESRERSHALFEKMAQIVPHKRIICFVTGIFWLLLQLFSITLSRARISLAPAQSVDRAAACNRYHPTEGFACLRRVMIRLFPNLEKNLL
jgi:hypothetical protein